MNIHEKNGSTYIDDVSDFNLEQTLECGQCFHFDRLGDMDYAVVAHGRLLHILQDGNTLVFEGKDMEEVESIWVDYFDLTRDYAGIKEALLKADDKLKTAITEKYGVRILNQEFHETLISFIISQNKQIPHIKKIVADLSSAYGKHLGSIAGREYYSFPDRKTLGSITEENFRELKTGFRAPYLKCASEYLNSIPESEPFKGKTYDEAKAELLQIKGVGEKVANCVLLFGLAYRNAFPVDVWVKRTMEEVYFEGKDTPKEKIAKFAGERFGGYGGYAQQYLFYYGRSVGAGKSRQM